MRRRDRPATGLKYIGAVFFPDGAFETSEYLRQIGNNPELVFELVVSSIVTAS
jgi:hypothetical protein